MFHPANLLEIVKFRKKQTVWQDDHPKQFFARIFNSGDA
jgi:hypothetical protein